MARHSAGYYQQQATYAQRIHNAAPVTAPAGTNIKPIPRSRVIYTPMYQPSPVVYEVTASVNSIAFLVGSNLALLGLKSAAAAGDDPQRTPRGFAPAKVHVQFRNKVGKRIQARKSERPYNYYGDANGAYNTNRTGQIAYSAPFSALDRTPATLITNFTRFNTEITPKATPNRGLLIRLTEEKFPTTDDIEPFVAAAAGG